MLKENCCRVSITKEGKLKVILPKRLFLNAVNEFREHTEGFVFVNSGNCIIVKNIEIEVIKSNNF